MRGPAAPFKNEWRHLRGMHLPNLPPPLPDLGDVRAAMLVMMRNLTLGQEALARLARHRGILVSQPTISRLLGRPASRRASGRERGGFRPRYEVVAPLYNLLHEQHRHPVDPSKPLSAITTRPILAVRAHRVALREGERLAAKQISYAPYVRVPGKYEPRIVDVGRLLEEAHAREPGARVRDLVDACIAMDEGGARPARLHFAEGDEAIGDVERRLGRDWKICLVRMPVAPKGVVTPYNLLRVGLPHPERPHH